MAVIKFRNPWAQNPSEEQLNNDDSYYADVEDALDDGFVEDDDEEAISYRGLIRVALRGLIAIAVLCGIVAVILYQSRNRSFGTANFSKVMELSVQEDTRWGRLGNNIFSYNKNGANCINDKAEKVWSITYEMQQPISSVAGDVAALADFGGSVIHIVNSKQVMGSVSTNLPIVDITVSQSGEVAAVLNDTDTTWVYLYTSDGRTIAYFKTTMPQSGYPVALAVSPSGELVCVSHLTVGNATANSSVAFYNFGAVGQNVLENNVSGFNYEDEVFPYLKYMEDGICAAVSNKRIAFYTGKEIPQSGRNAFFTKGEVQGVYSTDKYIGLLFSDYSGGDKYEMVIYSTDGEEVGGFTFDMEYSSIEIFEDRVIISNSQSMLLYSIKGNLRYSGDFDKTVRAVIPNRKSSGKYILITDNAMEQMVLE